MKVGQGVLRRRRIPALEVGLLAVFAVLPLLLKDFWVVFVTRVLILTLLGLSFDLLWGFAGIMSFGQALFFGAAGYGVALLARDLGIRSLFVMLPVSVLIGLLLSFAMSCFLLLGRRPPSIIFIALGTLTGAYAGDRLARGWYYLGGQNGIPSIPSMTASGALSPLRGPTFVTRVSPPSRVAKLGPKRLKWMCAGRHAFSWFPHGYAPGLTVTNR